MRAGRGLGRCGEGEGSDRMAQGEQCWEERWQGWGGMRWLVPPHRGVQAADSWKDQGTDAICGGG